jgi:hypothetical protein
MQIYEITYSLSAGGIIQIEANSEQEAEMLFDGMELEELFETKDLYRGIEIEEIN